MTVTKLTMQRAMQSMIKAFHLPHFTDENVKEVGRMLYQEVDNEWSDSHELMVEGYNSERANDTETAGYNQW